MSTHRRSRVTRRTAERLLRGEPVEEQAGIDRLTGLLAAAAAPVHDGELAGEQAAVHAFRTAHLRPIAQPGRTSVLSALLSKLLTVKIAAAAFTITAVGGVAVAATTAVLPPVHDGAPTGVPPSSSPVPSSSAPQEPPATPGAPGDVDRPGDARNGGPADAPAPSLAGLCHAYLAGAGTNPGKALDSPAFGALTTAAGGAQNVRGYCDGLLAARDGFSDGADPSQPAHPTTRPSTPPQTPASERADEHAPVAPRRLPSPATAPAPAPPAEPQAAEQAAEHAPSAPPGR